MDAGRSWTSEMTYTIYQCADEIPSARKELSVKVLSTMKFVIPDTFENFPVAHTETGKEYKYFRYNRKVKIIGEAAEVVPYYKGIVVGAAGMVSIEMGGSATVVPERLRSHWDMPGPSGPAWTTQRGGRNGRVEINATNGDDDDDLYA